MFFEDVTGNAELKDALRQMADSGRLGHAVLFSQEDGGGAFALALALAQYVGCETPGQIHKSEKLIHPDIHFVFPVSSANSLSESEKKAPISDYFLQQFRTLALSNPYFTEQQLYEAIGIDSKSCGISVHEARRMAEKLSLRSLESDCKTMIIFLPEKMNVEAANKLLKLLEEPPAGTLFIMISHHCERLLQTIRSRVRIFNLKPLSREEKLLTRQSNPSESEYADAIEALLEAGLAKNVAGLFPLWEALADSGREQQKDFCLYAENYVRNVFLCSKGLQGMLDIDGGLRSKVEDLARRIKPTFYARAFAHLESALGSIAANGNAKLIFCDLADKLLLSL